VRRYHAVFDEQPPVMLELPGILSREREGHALAVVAEGDNGAIEAALTAAGASRVTVEPLPLEEILVACLKGRNPKGNKS
jgi:hypothetical protein